MASNGSGLTDPTKASEAISKGKGKAAEDDAMKDAEDNDDDDMQEINLENVVGRRTRGRVIDFAKAAAENPAADDEDDDDDDFEDPDNNDTKMDED
ncbi:hypothetical protein CMQ_4408 [Grosmannia clavigera kw1407]|uniref:Histone chaperone domain-containing protein n=1 Tax=Grosmannia clavigera (strain kw1407 / UAMH 11150) TaxID=655863 RepID=F0XTL7_GROCL|nr:uncharacterized protein CMQ_4408 [Grosmannia clavigera kw1407]EFW98556.1 hypothetical protein CMQ_4408 [Grosmannia clavigera kw1407]